MGENQPFNDRLEEEDGIHLGSPTRKRKESIPHCRFTLEVLLAGLALIPHRADPYVSH